MTTEKIEYRKATDNDISLTFSIKQRSLKLLVDQICGWKEIFQKDYHRKSFTPNETQIIIYNDLAVGFFVLDENPNKVLIENIIIDLNYQSKGIETKVMKDIIAKSENKRIELQVLKINQRAVQFYERLGFITYEQTDLHYKMRK